jgi:predicted SAM-dependent methyltransferase
MVYDKVKKSLIVLIILFSGTYVIAAPLLKHGIDLCKQLSQEGLLKEGRPLKLHLGCGRQYLHGYVNIDYPLSEHTVQDFSVADVFGDITQIACLPNTIDEIRLHHVFEHFNRPTALALLCAWYMWLKPQGLIYIEVPDFLTSAKMMFDNQYSYIQKQIILRHVFGSHEASWALHCDGWYEEKFRHILSFIGYEIISVEYSSWKLTHNITIRACKTRNIELDELLKRANNILSESMVDEGDQKMLEVWKNKFNSVFTELTLP